MLTSHSRRTAPSTSEHHQKARAMLACSLAISSMAWRGMSTT